MTLQHLDISYNQIQGSVPRSWALQSAGTLAATLQTLLLDSNQLTGPLPDLSGMPALSCWSVANNWLLCGAVPTTSTCGGFNNTRVGEDTIQHCASYEFVACNV